MPKNTAGLATLAALVPYPTISSPRNSCGIQIGPDCFYDEGIDKVLDITAYSFSMNATAHYLVPSAPAMHR